jgi:hypothetical protein
MNTQELIELAVLDAMGLLDPEEREAFDASFSAAAPAVQAQVRREQTRLSLCEDLLPDVEPPAGLRAMVVEAVRRAMAMPAQGGRDGARRHRHAKAGALALIPARQVSPLWRAASVGFAAAAVTFGATFLHLRGQFTDLAAAVENDRLLSEMQGAVGSSYVVSLLTDPRTQTRELVAVVPGTRGQARLWSNAAWGEGDEVLLAMSNLPANPEGRGEPLRVYAVESGQMVGPALHEFEDLPGLQLVRFSSPEAASGTVRLAIAQVDENGVYQPVFMTPEIVAWLEIDFEAEDGVA